ncbi:MAG: hypothetical protein KJN71_09490 [Acidimicrobiia bacterium]|nr:hypothetical protein [Acidimicrobiia bacterium]
MRDAVSTISVLGQEDLLQEEEGSVPCGGPRGQTVLPIPQDQTKEEEAMMNTDDTYQDLLSKMKGGEPREIRAPYPDHEYCVDCGFALTEDDIEFTEGGTDCERCRRDDWAREWSRGH